MKSVRKMVLVPFREGLEESRGLEADLIISAMPKSLKRKAEALLRYIEKEVSWNDKGELVYRGETLSGSHITDLIRYTLQEYGEAPPPHYEAFLEILKRANVPKSVAIQRKNAFRKREDKTTWQKL